MTDTRSAIVRQPGEGHWVQWLGGPIRYLALGSETGGTYCLSVSEVPAGGGAPPHRHAFGEGFILTKGAMEFRVGPETVALDAGGAAHVGAWTPHAPKVTGDGSATVLVIAAPPGFDDFQQAAGEPLSGPDARASKTTKEIHTAITEIAGDYDIEIDPADEHWSETPAYAATTSDGGLLVDAVGDRYRFLLTGEQTDGRYAIWHATVGPGGGPPPHTHSREEEAFYVLSGELTFEADGERFTGGPGTFVNLPVGSRHRFANETDSPVEVLILVAPAGLEEMFQETGSVVTDASSPITPPSDEEKHRLHEIAPRFGVTLG